MTTPTPPSDLIEEIARSMLAVSRPNANADDLTPAPRGSLGMIPKWKLYEHLAQAAYAVVRERIEEIGSAVETAAIWFEEYARLHHAKGTRDGDHKARINEHRAEVMRSALKQRIDP